MDYRRSRETKDQRSVWRAKTLSLWCKMLGVEVEGGILEGSREEETRNEWKREDLSYSSAPSPSRHSLHF